MHNSIDFFKLKNGELGAINFNNMIPVTLNNVIMLELLEDNKTKEERIYIKMLKEQLYFDCKKKASYYYI